MKIFNWVQRRFHHNVIKDGLVGNVKKTDSIAIDTNTKALLEQVALVDVLDGWRDGILTIGTFGFDPLKSFGDKKDYLGTEHNEEKEERCSDTTNDEEDDEDEDDYYDDKYYNSDEEVNPLMFGTAFDVEPNYVDDDAKCGKTDHVIMTVGAGSVDGEIKFDLNVTSDIEGHSGKLRRRTTLADLFSEDSDDMKKKKKQQQQQQSPLELDSDYSCKKAPLIGTKKGLSFAKKLIPQVGEDSRPIKMLNQVMRRMLKRKIHPELEGKGNKMDRQNSLSASKNHEAAGESVSLLQSPDAATA